MPEPPDDHRVIITSDGRSSVVGLHVRSGCGPCWIDGIEEDRVSHLCDQGPGMDERFADPILPLSRERRCTMG